MEGGARVERKEVRGFLAKLPSPSSPSIQNRGGRDWGRPVQPASAIAGAPGHGSAWEVGQNEEGAEGVSTPCLPWAEVACGGGSA
jgi:hypothetical protein